MDYTFSPQRGLMAQLGEWLWFWTMIGIGTLVLCFIAYGMGKSDNSTGSNQRGSIENSAPADTDRK